jgi:hypothetical protein
LVRIGLETRLTELGNEATFVEKAGNMLSIREDAAAEEVFFPRN